MNVALVLGQDFAWGRLAPGGGACDHPAPMDRQRPSIRPTDGAERTYSLRLAGAASCAPDASAALDAPESLPAGTGAGAADRGNPLRIDAYAAISATLDPATRAVFDEAVATLRALKAGREQVEAKLKETGREDAIRTVTGVSALDSAIERTEAIIRSLGEMRRLAAEAERI